MIVEIGRKCTKYGVHYRIRVLCRVPGAHGKVPEAHGNSHAVRCTRQTAHGTGPDGERLLRRVPYIGHTAKHDAVRSPQHTAHKSDVTAAGCVTASFAVCPQPAHGKSFIKKNLKIILCRVPPRPAHGEYCIKKNL